MNRKFCDLLVSLPTSQRDITFIVVIFYVLCEELENMMKQYIEQIFPSSDIIQATQKNDKYDNKSDGMRFFGWALISYRQLQIRTLEKTKKVTKDVVTSKMKLLNDMITTEEKVVNDENYMSRCYTTVDTLYNKEKLTLVAKKYYDIACSIIDEIDKHVNEQKIHLLRNDVMKVAYKELKKMKI